MNEITERLARLDELTTDELAALAADIRAAYDTAKADGPAENETGAEWFATLTAFRDGLAAVNDRQVALATEVAEAEQILADLDAEVAAIGAEPEIDPALEALTDDERAALATLAELSDEDRAAVAELVVVETPAEPDATVTDITPDPEAPAAPAAEEETPAARAAAAMNRLPARARQPQPAAPARPTARIPGTRTPMEDADVMPALMAAVMAYGDDPQGAGRRERVASVRLGEDVPVLAAGQDFSEFYAEQLGVLRSHRQAAITTRQASGAICAPAMTDYTVIALGTEDQPIGNLFPRGGGVGADAMKNLSFFQALELDDYDFGDDAGDASAATKGIGSATATQNNTTPGAAGSPYPKTALRAACPTPVTCEQRAVWLELVFDYLSAAAWPENTEATRQAGRIALAKELEELRLEDWYDAADAANLVLAPQTIGQPYSGSHSFVQTILAVVTHDRAQKRDWNAPYVAAIPAWLEPALATEVLAMLDIASGSMDVDQARAEILRRYGVTVTSYLDGFGKSDEARTTSNDFDTFLPRLDAAALVPQLGPCEARIGIARDDAGFVRVGDELNLGVLRTETDLQNNDWRLFEETFSRLCFRQPPIVADVRVDPSAAVAAGITPVDNCAGSGS